MNPMQFLPTLTRVLEEVNQVSLPGPGFTRPSYSEEESRAHECVASICEALGLQLARWLCSRVAASRRRQLLRRVHVLYDALGASPTGLVAP